MQIKLGVMEIKVRLDEDERRGMEIEVGRNEGGIIKKVGGGR